MRSLKGLLLISILIGIILFPILCLSCNSRGEEFNTMWSEDSKSYRTNELSVAQKETPFKIVLPEYVPNDLLHYPFIRGVARSEFKETRPISVMYYRRGESFNPILIDEYNVSMIYQPSDNFTYINILGIDVIEETTSMLKDITTFITSYQYAWNNDNIHYDVKLAEYPKEEGRKIVESMIKQMK